MADLRKLEQKLERLRRELPGLVATVVEVEGTNFITDNFARQGFQGSSTVKWKARKLTDRKGRDKTRYRTDRRGRKGDVTKFGRQNQPDRPILTGFKSGGNKLRHSIEATSSPREVKWTSYKPYAQRHNEGLTGMPKRQFMGKSPKLDNMIKDELTQQLDKRLKQ